MSETPPPMPPLGARRNPAAQKSEAPAPPGPQARYNQIADKVGLVPNVRKKDNVYQGICVLAFAGIGVAAGWFWDGAAIREMVGDSASIRMLLGGLIGLVLGALLSGLVIMVLGFLRKT